MTGRLEAALTQVRWYLREVGGTSRWERYLEQCARDGVAPMSRRAFERHRDDHREQAAQGRCC